MTVYLAILNCTQCFDPMRLVVLEDDPASAIVTCAYCDAKNACELGSIVKDIPVDPKEVTHFWNSKSCRNATSGLDLHAPHGRAQGWE